MSNKKKDLATTPISLTGFIITVVVVCLSFFSVYAVFLLIFGLLPGLIAVIVDKGEEVYLSKIVLSFNFAGVFPFIGRILSDIETGNRLATQYILDPNTWFYMYAASAVGWCLYWFVPNLNIFVKNIIVQFKIFELNNELHNLTKEWGDNIKDEQSIK